MFQTPFTAQQSFCDPVNFPAGFSQSSVLSQEQADMLEQHGEAYFALATGIRQPLSLLEQEFVRFCQGLRQPRNLHERTWHSYMQEAACA